MKPLALSLALALPLTLTACGGGAEVEGGSGAGTGNGAPGAPAADLPAPKTESDRAMVAFIERLEGIEEVVKGVTDPASAQAAAEKIRAISDELNVHASSLEKLPEDERLASIMRYSDELQAVQMRIGSAMAPLALKPQIAQTLSDAMSALPKPSAK